MNREQITFEIKEAFGHVQRPETFIRGTCSCDECLEHEANMNAFLPEDLPLEKLSNPGWDPICFASNGAFLYFMPGLAELVLEHTDEYVQQFIFHIEQPERLEAFTPKQALALVNLLDFLVINKTDMLENNSVVDELYRTKEKLENI